MKIAFFWKCHGAKGCTRGAWACSAASCNQSIRSHVDEDFKSHPCSGRKVDQGGGAELCEYKQNMQSTQQQQSTVQLYRGVGRPRKGLSQATRALHQANIVSDGCSGYLGVHQSHRFRHRRPKTGETGIQVLRSHSQVLYTGLALNH